MHPSNFSAIIYGLLLSISLNQNVIDTTKKTAWENSRTVALVAQRPTVEIL